MQEASPPRLEEGRLVRVEWNTEQQTFVVYAAESITDQFPAPAFESPPRSFVYQKDEDNAERDVAKLATQFQEIRNEFVELTDIQGLRTQAMITILSSQEPQRRLPAFLVKWQNVLNSIGERVDAISSTAHVDYCQELIVLARSWKLIGDITQARFTLGKCLEITRRHLEAPLPGAVVPTTESLRCVAVTAKNCLLECVAIQTSLERNKELFDRREAPPHILTSLSRDFWLLIRQTPFSIEIALLLAQSLMKQRQFDVVARFLEHWAIGREHPAMTLVRARALAYTGFYRQSLEIVQVFFDQQTKPNDDTVSDKALKAYHNRLKDILVQHEKADESLRLEQYKDAADGYDKCLAIADSVDHKQIGALLFGRGNALIGLGSLHPAINDLRKSLSLDPTNKLTSVRLQTVCLREETDRIKTELLRNRAAVKLA
ncbi:unnamed protein product [Phytophthora lilii]|uniref:Unnamed protein product n=1 Tax=Phytophthora lilii TaxID=2077276 RepID=A0A9W6TJP0_9STRA|nr:unnamed protein product [Phytophthora lilii]